MCDRIISKLLDVHEKSEGAQMLERHRLLPLSEAKACPLDWNSHENTLLIL
jgi:hypothetical protein